MRKMLWLALSCIPVLAHADNGTGALTGSLGDICLAANPGTDLFARCQEFQSSSDPLAAAIIAAAQGLEELPGQGRASTSNQQPDQIILDDFGEGWSLFLGADIGRLKRSASFNEAAFDGNADRLTASLNYQVNTKWLIGLSANHSHETQDFSNSGSSNDALLNGILLASNFTPTASLGFDFYYGRFTGNTDNVRNIQYEIETSPGNTLDFSSQAFANTDASRNVSGLSGAWLWNKDAWSGDVRLGVDRSFTVLDAYTESGGDGFALEVPERKIESTTGYLGFSVSKAYSVSWGVLLPSLRASLRKEFSNPSRQLTVQFAQDPSNTDITFDTSDPDSQWGEMAIGVNLVMKKGQQAFFEYRQRFAHSFLQERSLALGWRIEF